MAARAMNGLVCPDRQSGHRPPPPHLGRRLHVPAHCKPPWWNRLPSDRPRAGRFVARARPGQRPTNAAALASTPSKGSLAGCYFKLSARVLMPQSEFYTIPIGSNGSSPPSWGDLCKTRMEAQSPLLQRGRGPGRGCFFSTIASSQRLSKSRNHLRWQPAITARHRRPPCSPRARLKRQIAPCYSESHD